MNWPASSPLWQERAYAIVRIIVGLLLVYHGIEIFDKKVMGTYFTWEVFDTPVGVPLVYAGKAAELLAGLLIAAGWWTRAGALLCIGTMLFITFIVGQGKFWYEDQHPFMFVLFGVLFFFKGAGQWSLDSHNVN